MYFLSVILLTLSLMLPSTIGARPRNKPGTADKAKGSAKHKKGAPGKGGTASKTQPAAKKPGTHRPKASKRLSKKEFRNVHGGTHWRIVTAHGPVHVWIPRGYKRKTAGIVIYIHGYHSDVDQAWKQYNLPRQFRKSRQNAIFIVPEAPQGKDDTVKWNSLKHLKKAVTKANIRLPNGPTVVIGHSGAFRTIVQWVNARLLKQIILLDAMYGGQSFFDQFIKKKITKLVIVGSDTAQASTQFLKKYPYAAVRKNIPASFNRFTKRQKRAKLFYMKSQYGHGQIVRNEKVIPLLLRLTPLRHL
ncbi:hypothetical protein KKF84_10805 [Myxococcota bacterium]|nr:hypothetical protein [Myxococcota bacterium]